MINVLVNAYAVSPTWGSEPGVGWNWITNIAKQCRVFVITESEWEQEINLALKELPEKENIHFYFNPVPQKVRNMCWRQGDWRFYRYYRIWQKQTLKIAYSIISKHRIDVIHQLNMIGFREPGYLWKIKDIPFVWGPIGNMAPVPLRYLEGCRLYDKMKLGVKNVISYYQARTGRVSKAIRRADRIIAVLDSTAAIIKNEYGRDDVIVMPETGLQITKKVVHEINAERPLKLLWVGRFIPTKKLDIALKVMAKLDARFQLHIVGWGTAKEEAFYKNLANSLDINDRCVWYGKIENQRVQSLMKECDIFLFTSVVEGTPHVILEAIQNNLPIICFDTCGQGVIVNDRIGWKIPMSSFGFATREISQLLIDCEGHREYIIERSQNCELLKPVLSWESKINRVIELYRQVSPQ